MEKIKWGVLGTAGIANGATIPGMLLAKNCEVYAIAGRSEEKVKSFAEKFGFKKSYIGYDALLADPEVQAVYIPLPNDIHAEWILKSIEAGKHVLCEKPMARDVKEAEMLYKAAKEKGVVLMEAFAYLHSPYVKALKEEVSKKTIGDITYVEAAFLGGRPLMTDFRMHKEFLGGAAYDLGCYCTSMILTLIGKEPEKVLGTAEYSEEGIDLFTTAELLFGNGVRGHLSCGMIFESENYRRYDRLYIHGTKGIIRSEVEFNQAGNLKYTVSVDGVETVKTVEARQNYCLEVEQLGRCITDGEKPYVSPEFSIMHARTLDKVLEAIGYNN